MKSSVYPSHLDHDLEQSGLDGQAPGPLSSCLFQPSEGVVQTFGDTQHPTAFLHQCSQQFPYITNFKSNIYIFIKVVKSQAKISVIQ